MGCFFVRFKNNKPVLHLSKFQINPLASGLIERNIKAKGEHLFLELSAPQRGLLCALCSPSRAVVAGAAEPHGQSRVRRPGRKGPLWEPLQISLFHALKAGWRQCALCTLGILFPDLKDFLASRSNGRSAQHMLSLLILLLGFFLLRMLSEGGD